MICPYCQSANEDTNLVCLACGKSMDLNTSSSQTDAASQPKKSSALKINKFLLVIIVLFIILIFSSLGLFLSQKKVTTKTVKNSTSMLPTISITQINISATPAVIAKAITTKYDLDSDSDSIPDFVEIATGFDPKKDECFLSACEVFDPNKISATALNILFILDSSGSMAAQAGNQVKMEAAKSALQKYVKSLTGNTNIGLMVYGHKGSNATTDKQLSCAGIDLIYPISKPDLSAFDQTINSFQPTGWTPIGGSLRKAKEAFVGKEGQNNRVVVITDGIETCDSDPISAAHDLQNMDIKPVIDIIGLALDATAKNQLQLVAKSGGGTYFDAQTSDEFEKVLNNWAENTGKNTELLGCRAGAALEFISCVNARSIKGSDYLTQISLALYGSELGKNIVPDKEDAHDRVRYAQMKMREYSNKANELFQKSNDQMQKDWLTNREKIGKP